MSKKKEQKLFGITDVMFSTEQLIQLFPYHLMVQRDMSIVQMGEKLRELCPDIHLHQKLDKEFQISCESEDWSKEEMLYSDQLFYLERTRQRVVIKGNFCPTSEEDIFLFTGHFTYERLFEERRMLSYNIAQAGLKYRVDPQGFAKYVHEQIKKFCDAENFHLTLYEKDLNRLNTIYLHDSFYPMNKFYIRKFDKGLSEYVIESGNTLLIKKSQLGQFIGSTEHKPMGGIAEVWLMVPLKGPDGVKGVITIESIESENAFTEDDKLLMEFVATQVIQVLERHEAIKEVEDMAKLPAESPNPILRINIEDEIIYFNKASEKIIIEISRDNEIVSQELLDAIRQSQTDNRSIELDLPIGNSFYSFYVTPVEEFDYVNIYAQDVTDRKEVLRTLEKEKETVLKYQSQLLSSQLTPHFIFNTLNSIQYYIFNRDLEPGLNFLANFSKMIRKVLENSENEFITINEEIEFLNMYLTLAQSRDMDKFEFDVTMDVELRDMEALIPPMLIQPFVENAIIHGVGPLKTGGLVSVQFHLMGEMVTCVIQDNGVGIKKAEELKQVRSGSKKSMGSAINNKRLDILNELSDNGYTAKIESLYSNKEITKGAKVTITFPLVLED